MIAPAAVAIVVVVALLLLFVNRAGAADIPEQGQTLSYEEILPLAMNAGFSGDDLNTAVAVALAESGGQTDAYNPEAQVNAPEGKGSYGLWQIFLNKHPEFAGWNLNDPQTNANAAYSVYLKRGRRFLDWSTFNSGAYEQYLR